MTYKINLPASKKVYFASDFHLGAPDFDRSLERERKIVRWLNSIAEDAHTVFILGDIFDFWYEYRHVVPRGFVRILGKLAELSDAGIEIIIFTGNHDMWSFGYLEEEIGAKVYRRPQPFEINGVRFLLGHGDGLGPGDRVYKMLKKVFENKVCRWLFSRLHPNFAVSLAKAWSSRSRAAELKKEERFFGEEEWLIQYCKKIEASSHHDYYLFGHRHYPIEFPLNDTSVYLNLGEWMNYFTYAEFDGHKCRLKSYSEND